MDATFSDYLNWYDRMMTGEMRFPRTSNWYYTITETPYMADTVSVQRRRGWRERLFSRPWRPLEKYRYSTQEVPRRDIMILENEKMLIMHPTVAIEFRKMLEEQSQ